MASQLLSITKSLPLRPLKSGATLVIQAAPLPFKLSLHVHLVPQRTREDGGHVTLHQTLPRLQHGSIFADMTKEVDMDISTIYQDGKKYPLIQIWVDWKKTKQPLLEKKQDTNFSWGHKHAHLPPLHYQEGQNEEESYNLQDRPHTREMHMISSQPRYRYITDDGRFLVALPKKPTTGLITETSDPNDTIDPLTGIEQVEYTDGIIHVKNSSHSASLERIHNSNGVYPTQTIHTRRPNRSMDHTISMHNESSSMDTIVQLTATIPEKCNVRCLLQHLSNSQSSISMEQGSKLEGEEGFEFVTMGGNIHISKLRGNNIHLSTNGCTQYPDTLHTHTTLVDKNETTRGKGGNIHVAQALEAQDLHVMVGEGGRFRAKLIHASHAKIGVQDSSTHVESGTSCDPVEMDAEDGLAKIDISSIYTTQMGSGANLTVSSSYSSSDESSSKNIIHATGRYMYNPRKVRVANSHGHISVLIKDYTSQELLLSSRCNWFDAKGRRLAVVDLGSVNGSFHVHLQHQSASNHKWVAPVHNLGLCARVHVDNLSYDQPSFLYSEYLGLDTELTVDQKLETDVRFLSSPWIHHLDTEQLLSADEDFYNFIQNQIDFFRSNECKNDGEMQKEERDGILIKTNSYVRRSKICSYDTSFEGGHLTGINPPLINHLGYNRADVNVAIGKVARDGAQSQALNTFSTQEKRSESSSRHGRTMVIATNGIIHVDSLNWMQAISRRHGL